jgi:hypothetical protein
MAGATLPGFSPRDWLLYNLGVWEQNLLQKFGTRDAAACGAGRPQGASASLMAMSHPSPPDATPEGAVKEQCGRSFSGVEVAHPSAIELKRKSTALPSSPAKRSSTSTMHEAGLPRIVDARARDVRRQKVGRELDAREVRRYRGEFSPLLAAFEVF